MWIKSQNEKVLMEVNKVYIKNDNSIWSGSMCLGIYDSEDRAMKVLEEIGTTRTIQELATKGYMHFLVSDEPTLANLVTVLDSYDMPRK
ncbi:hypothetical protein [Clostridium algidicarnis]|uniref:hypothetical protein n=1 Tax=Clostridium algidicarnis TaxID=37659 RepID=UPI001C0C5896|nr:hypothetical protein [Clostridium algidicarnis]MBU3193491.1 hypothetical protein [Clostridium algidicarnis]MBU3203103.1 hypothetical protein [Clostridium algidicarnis]MBU3205599.1 hypothetical protein [Clostridium algidicarnis]MBU3211257.1 hypothetical protein [Clostridium algidicarnis]MBU3222235.1 hypothetical protein [Clostridium algidicarnis]